MLARIFGIILSDKLQTSVEMGQFFLFIIIFLSFFFLHFTTTYTDMLAVCSKIKTRKQHKQGLCFFNCWNHIDKYIIY